MKKIIIVALGFILSSCANLKNFKNIELFKKSEKVNKDLERFSVQELYEKGYGHFARREYRPAAEAFSTIYYKAPGTPLSAEAEILEAYSLYKLSDFGEAIDILDNFILIHPEHKYLAYAKYLQAICYIRQMLAFTKDQENTIKAKQVCTEFIKQYPKTRYAEDLRLRLVMIEDVLAAHEVEVARYYINKKMPLAALKRLSNIMENYKDTNHYHEALYRSLECYQILGFSSEADKVYEKLANHPESKWFAYANILYNKR
jgi:outer membrane protein assembly factor BamD